MKSFSTIIFLSSILLFACCSKQKETKISHTQHPVDAILEIPKKTVDKAVLDFNNTESLWTLNNQPYSGFYVSYYLDSTLKEKTGILDGKKQNIAIHWFPNGNYKFISNYYKGRLHGERKIWSSDSSHVLLSHLNYHSGKPHGEQKKWYITGELHKSLNLNMGREEGIQQAFRENGDLYANYEAREGRIFGLKKSALCYELENEKIQHEK